MPENRGYAEDLATALEETSGRKSEAEVSAEAFLRRLDTDKAFRRYVKSGLTRRKNGTKRGSSTVEDDE
jgi:hypothetical protein